MALSRHQNEIGKNDMERVSTSTLVSDHCDGFLHNGDVDVYKSEAVHGSFLYGPIDATCGNRRHIQFGRWPVDGGDRTKSDGCGRWIPLLQEVFDPRS